MPRRGSPRLLTVGEAFDDFVFIGLDRLPRLGEEVRTNTFHATVGGGAVITAVAATRLGLSTRVLSSLSDAAARRLRAEGVRADNVRRRDEPTAITAVLSTSFDRSFVTFTGSNITLERRLLRRMTPPRGSHVHLALGPADSAAWIRLTRRLRRDGHTVSWDFGWHDALASDARLPELMAAADLVFFNEREAIHYAGEAALDAACVRWRSRHGNVVVKLGARGSRWLRADGDVEMPAPAVTVVDTTGAGDAFNAGFLSAWLGGAPPATCLATGNFVGACSTRAAGGLEALPTIRQLPRLLRSPLASRRRLAPRAPQPSRTPASSRRRPT